MQPKVSSPSSTRALSTDGARFQDEGCDRVSGFGWWPWHSPGTSPVSVVRESSNLEISSLDHKSLGRDMKKKKRSGSAIRGAFTGGDNGIGATAPHDVPKEYDYGGFDAFSGAASGVPCSFSSPFTAPVSPPSPSKASRATAKGNARSMRTGHFLVGADYGSQEHLKTESSPTAAGSPGGMSYTSHSCTAAWTPPPPGNDASAETQATAALYFATKKPTGTSEDIEKSGATTYCRATATAGLLYDSTGTHDPFSTPTKTLHSV